MVSEIVYEKVDELEQLHGEMMKLTNEVGRIIEIFKSELP